jgi:1-deoxy-D-xylulose-5-phosphate synthase
MKFMMEAMPDRAFDVGICEQHAVTLSAGLATQGVKAFCNIYSSFMQRAYDQVIHDVALQKLPVIFCLDRAGLVGEDGPTHHGCYDIAFFRCIPNLIIAAPMNEQELRNMMYTAQLPSTDLPFVIRYPRGEGVMVDWKKPFEQLAIGQGRRLKEGKDVAILTFGHPGNNAQTAIRNLRLEGIDPAHYDMRFVKPLDEALLHEVFQNYPLVVTVEDATVVGGLGSAVLEFMNAHNYHSQVRILGIPDTIVEHGSVKELQQECHYDAMAIANAVKNLLGKSVLVEG